MRYGKTNNKGYSLIELVLTIAIFSIIMVSIILMMRSSLATYKDGLFETSMQEEAQIVANQVADLLVDAKSVSGGGGTYTIGTAEGTNAKLEQIGNKLYYNDDHLLSDQLKADPGSFNISGLEHRDSSDKASTYDNSAIVTISLESNGKSYVASKEVYFRNKIEDIAYDGGAKVDTPFDVSGKSTISSGTPNPDDENFPVLRFQPVDISAMCDIVYDAELSDPAKGYFQDLGSTSSANSMITNALPGKTPMHYVLKLAPAYETASGFDDSFSGDAYFIKGKDSKGNDKTVYLTLDAVSLDEQAGVFTIKYNTDEYGDNGYPTYIEAKGISINDAISSLGGITYTAKIKSNGTTKYTYSDKSVLHTTTPYVKGITSKGSTPTGGSLPLVIAGDPLTSGMEMSTTKCSRIDFLENNANKNTIDVDFKIDGRTYSVSYYITYSGGTLEYMP